MVSVLVHTTVPLHGIICHSLSDINRNLIGMSYWDVDMSYGDVDVWYEVIGVSYREC